MDLLNPLQTGLFILLFIPGFIFIQTIERHLLRERKPQFEKTLEIVLASSLIWMLALSLPWYWPFGESRDLIVGHIKKAVLENWPTLATLEQNVGNEAHPLELPGSDAVLLFLSVSVWSFLLATGWGIIRKFRRFDAIVRGITGRDWYPSVIFRFFKENLNRMVEVRAGDDRYIGVLYSAPDTLDDRYIIITDAHKIIQISDTSWSLLGALFQSKTEYKIEKLSLVEHIVIRYDEIDQIRSYSGELTTQI